MAYPCSRVPVCLTWCLQHIVFLVLPHPRPTSPTTSLTHPFPPPPMATITISNNSIWTLPCCSLHSLCCAPAPSTTCPASSNQTSPLASTTSTSPSSTLALCKHRESRWSKPVYNMLRNLWTVWGHKDFKHSISIPVEYNLQTFFWEGFWCKKRVADIWSNSTWHLWVSFHCTVL